MRNICTSEFPFTSTDEFIGFMCGIVSQDHDLQELYLDSFMDIAFIKDKKDVEEVFVKLDSISRQFSVDFVISVSLEPDEVPEKFKSQVIVSL